jgi:hypothetical protein
VVAQAHEVVRELIRPGLTTLDLDRAVEEFLTKQNAIPAFQRVSRVSCVDLRLGERGCRTRDSQAKMWSCRKDPSSAWILVPLWTASVATVPGRIQWVKLIPRRSFCSRPQRKPCLKALSRPGSVTAFLTSPMLYKCVQKNKDFLLSGTSSDTESGVRCTKHHKFRILDLPEGVPG